MNRANPIQPDDAEARERAAGVCRADYIGLFTPQVLTALRALPFLQKNGMAEQDFAATLEFYSKRYLRQIPDYLTVTPQSVIADVGCGVGFLAITLALETPARVIGVESNPESLATARAIAKILGLEDRVEFRAGDLSVGIGLKDREADLVYCVEVLEHVYRNKACVAELLRVVGRYLVMTTPNLWFPKVAHDTRLPFAHWLPIPLRKTYARLARRDPAIDHNLFWSAPGIDAQFAGFQRVSRFLHYRGLHKFLETYPFYVPYDRGYWEHAPGKAKLAYYRALARLPAMNYFALPNLAGTFKRL